MTPTLTPTLTVSKAREAHRRLRNTCRFLLGNLHDYDHALPPLHHHQPAAAGAEQGAEQGAVPWVARAWGAPRSVPALRQFDRYMMHQLARYAGAAEEGYDRLAFHKVMAAAAALCSGARRASSRHAAARTHTYTHTHTYLPPSAPSNPFRTVRPPFPLPSTADDLSAHYLVAAKDRLYCLEATDPSRRAAQARAARYPRPMPMAAGLAPMLTHTHANTFHPC